MTPSVGERVLRWRGKMSGWIHSVARRARTRFHAEEDLEQEADIMIWRLIEKYPEIEKRESEFIGMIKASFCRRLASLLGQKRSKRSNMPSLNLEIDLRLSTEHPEFWYQDRIRELIRRCEDPRLKRWIRKNLAPGRYGSSGMKKEEYAALKELAEQLF